MAGSNGLTRLAVLLLLHGSSNDSKPSNKWTTLGSYMTWLFAFSIVGTIITYCMLDDKAALNSGINKAILSGLESGVGEEYHILLKALVDNPMMIGNSLGALIFLGFSVVSFVIILIVLMQSRTEIPESIVTGETNTLAFLKETARLVRSRLFFVETEGSSFANSYLAGNSIDALRYVYGKHKNGILLKVKDLKDSQENGELSGELLKIPMQDYGNSAKQTFTKVAYIFTFLLLALMYGGLLWMVALTWLPLVVYLICRSRKHQLFGSLKPNADGKNIEDLFRGVGLQIVEEQKTQGSIETSCLTDAVIDQIEKEISNNENKSYFRINK
ncbi:hypothetical protein [Phascolarctobacterium sp.]|uniref:hypothetical protein n=1 Tax=Phascolarctobacterium sp. TaxID=2049039 RepID=UPI0025FC2D98|nr:hypothetical protein [Phascolarctobacterium sp.]